MRILNKKAGFDYELKEHFEAGIQLIGSEVKAIRLGHVDLSSSHVKIMGSEAYLINSKIFAYKYARPEDYQETRTRKLLLHKQEILSIKAKMDGQNLTIVPVSLYTKNALIKVELAFARGKKEYQKKESIKKRDIQRDLDREL